MYSGIRRALISRLTGLPLSDVDEAIRNGDSVRTGLTLNQGSRFTRQPQSTGYFREQPDRHDGNTQAVQVFPYRLDGTGINVWPAIGVHMLSFTPRLENYVWKDPIRRDVPGTQRTIQVGGAGDTVVRANLQTVRAHPRPYDITFEIGISSRHEEEVALITERVYDLLDQKGFLEIELRSGEVVTYDTLLEEGQSLSMAAGSLDGQGLAEYSHNIPIRIEGYADNSLATEIMRIISKRSLCVGEYDGRTQDYTLDSDTTHD